MEAAEAAVAEVAVEAAVEAARDRKPMKALETVLMAIRQGTITTAEMMILAIRLETPEPKKRAIVAAVQLPLLLKLAKRVRRVKSKKPLI